MNLAGIFVLINEENNYKSNNLIFYNFNDVYCIDGTNGKELWKKTYDKRIIHAVRSSDMKYLFVQNLNQKINYLDVNTGKEILLTPIKEKGELIDVDYTKKGYIIKTKKGINIIDSLGQYKFEKNIAKNIQAYEVEYLEDGFIISNYFSKARKENEDNKIRQQSGSNAEIAPTNTNNNNNARLNFAKYNFAGDKIWSKDIFQGNCSYIPLNKGVMIVSEEMADMYGFADGNSLWPNDIKLKGETSFGYDYENLKIFAYNKNKIESFNTYIQVILISF